MADVPCAFGDISDSSPMTHGSAYFFLLPNMHRDVVVVVVVVVVEALLLAARERDEDPGMKAETMAGRVSADARRRGDFIVSRLQASAKRPSFLPAHTQISRLKLIIFFIVIVERIDVMITRLALLFVATCLLNPVVTSLSFVPLTTITTAASKSVTQSTFKYTHLEANGQLWQIHDNANADASLSIVIDPMATQLDFGVPWGYRANKKLLSTERTLDLIYDAKPTYCLLTMGLDDHTHISTLQQLVRRLPEMKYVIAPSCVDKMHKLLSRGGGNDDRLILLEHGQSYHLLCNAADGGAITTTSMMVTATKGALVGPPWQKRENGYLLTSSSSSANSKNYDDSNKTNLSIYYEPHGDVNMNDIQNIRANIIISPVTKQSLPAQVPPAGQFTLVYGAERTIQIANTLHANVIVPLGNGELDIQGPLAGLVASSGNINDFEKLVDKRNNHDKHNLNGSMKVMRSTPGIPLTIAI